MAGRPAPFIAARCYTHLRWKSETTKMPKPEKCKTCLKVSCAVCSAVLANKSNIIIICKTAHSALVQKGYEKALFLILSKVEKGENGLWQARELVKIRMSRVALGKNIGTMLGGHSREVLAVQPHIC